MFLVGYCGRKRVTDFLTLHLLTQLLKPMAGIWFLVVKAPVDLGR